MYKAANALCGFKRLLPGCKHFLEVSNQYYKNRSRTVPRKRALPLKAEWLRAFAVYAHTQKLHRMVLLLLAGFLGLFRVDELLSLKFAQLTFLSPSLLYVTIPDSKGAKLKGQPEHVCLKDVMLLAALRRLYNESQGYDLVFPYTYGEVQAFLKSAAEYFGLPADLATSHCLRRGGATWPFATYGSFDLTCDHGRWRNVSTCRVYINTASADLGSSVVRGTFQGGKRVAGRTGKVGVVGMSLYSVCGCVRTLFEDLRSRENHYKM